MPFSESQWKILDGIEIYAGQVFLDKKHKIAIPITSIEITFACAFAYNFNFEYIYYIKYIYNI